MLSVTLELIKEDGMWHIEIDDDLLNALMGDLVGAAEAMGLSVIQ